MENKLKSWGPGVWWSLAALSVFWWTICGQRSLGRSVLLATISVAAAATGCLFGFLFSSYGEESGTIGKVRDWLIGAATGLTIAKASSIKNLLVVFAYGPGPVEFALAAGSAVIFFSIGFFMMYFGRELFLNPALARSRSDRDRIASEGTRVAGIVTQRLSAILSPSLLSGIDNIEDMVKTRKSDAEKLRVLFDDPDVVTFLDEAENASKNGAPLDWDIVSKVANLHYYKTYFVKDGEKTAQEELAFVWIQRALVLNPMHVDLTVKYADVLARLKRYTETVALLEGLDRSNESPAYIKQWLGYYLLYIPGKEDEAIHYSRAYHQLFPEESDSLFNVARAYAQKYRHQLRTLPADNPRLAETHRHLFATLHEAIRLDQDETPEDIRDWLMETPSFECLADDPEFQALISAPTNTSAPQNAAENGKDEEGDDHEQTEAEDDEH